MTSQSRTICPDQKTAVRQQFGAAAANYATARVHRTGPDLMALTEIIATRRRQNVLDLGCGAGHTALAVAPHADTVTAIDLTSQMLEQTESAAQKRGLDNVEVGLGDAENLNFESESFDTVVCRLCAHHFSAPGRALGEVRRVLKRGGEFLLVDIVSPESPTFDSFLNAIEIVRDPSHVRDHTPSQWLAMMGAAGLAAECVGVWQMRLEFDPWIRRIGATDEARNALEEMFRSASEATRSHFSVEGTPVSAFSIENRLFRAIVTD